MKRKLCLVLSFVFVILFSACVPISEQSSSYLSSELVANYESLAEIPEYNDSPYVIINDNIPEFDKTDYTESFEEYGELDYLGRCTVCFANVGKDIMPTEKRGSIGAIKPTGWKTVKYDNIDGKYLYNRCHLIGYQLTAENANPNNLITGTRYLNIEGMLPFENEVDDYIESTNNHVLYRVTPIFKDEELVARGVHMEAFSIEDNGKGVCFNVYCYNVQPEIEINYNNGDSRYVGSNTSSVSFESNRITYVVNINTKKFHYPECESAKKTKDENKKTYTGYRESLINNGYEPCSQCKP